MFAHRLARDLNCTVEELDERVTPDQFMECLAFEHLSPSAGERADYLAAMLCTIIANAWSKKRWAMKDFLPKWGRPEQKRGNTQAEILAWAQRCVAQQNRKVKSGRPVD